MKIHQKSGKSLFLALGFLALGTASTAQAGNLSRAYLSGGGNDSNPCTLQQPCRFLPAGLAAAAVGGQVVLLDSAQYNSGPVTIGQNVTILAAPGAAASVLADTWATSAITIKNSVSVTLRNVMLHENADGCSFAGIPPSNCTGVSVPGSSALSIFASEFEGLDTAISASAGASLNVFQSTFQTNGYAIRSAGANASLNVFQSTFLGNAYAIDIAGTSTSSPAKGVVDQCTIINNGNGVIVGGYGSVALSRSNVSNNTNGLVTSSTGLVRIDDNIFANNHTATSSTSMGTQTTGNNDFFNDGIGPNITVSKQ